MARRRKNPSRANSAAFRAGYARTFAKPRRRTKSAVARSRARAMPRDRFGHFLKRRSAPKRRAAPRRAPMVRRRFHARRARGTGRFATRYTPKYVMRARRRPGVRKHLRAIRSIPARHRVAGLVRLNPRTGEITMSRRAIVANPRRRRRRNPKRQTATVVNRRRKRRNPRRRSARTLSNPSLGGALRAAKASALPMGMGALGGAATGFLDAKVFHDKPTMSIISKAGLGILGAMLLRKKPNLAMGFAGGCFGSLGYAFGLKFGGGLVATSKLKAVMGIGEMADNDPEMAAMLAGLGDIVPDGMGDASEYEAALGDVVNDDMGDVVAAYDE